MRITRKTNITVTTEQKFIVQKQTAKEIVCCEQCRAEMISAHVSAEFFGISSREIYRLIEAGKIHFVETDRNEIYICPVSVEQTAGTRTK